MLRGFRETRAMRFRHLQFDRSSDHIAALSAAETMGWCYIRGSYYDPMPANRFRRALGARTRLAFSQISGG